jgi:hypothetical protein
VRSAALVNTTFEVATRFSREPFFVTFFTRGEESELKEKNEGKRDEESEVKLEEMKNITNLPVISAELRH